MQPAELGTDETTAKTVGGPVPERPLVHKGRRDLKAFWRMLDEDATNEALPCH